MVIIAVIITINITRSKFGIKSVYLAIVKNSENIAFAHSYPL